MKVWVIAFLLAIIGTGYCLAQSADEAAEAKIAQEINDIRAKQGLKPLKVDVRLRLAARNHSTLMAKHKEMKDQFPEEASLQDRIASSGMKNVDSGAENSGQNRELDKVNQMFLDSPTHKANIMNPKFNAMGIAVVKDNETNWVTQIFVTTRSSVQEVK